MIGSIWDYKRKPDEAISSEIIRTDLSLKQRTETIEETCLYKTNKEAHAKDPQTPVCQMWLVLHGQFYFKVDPLLLAVLKMQSHVLMLQSL